MKFSVACHCVYGLLPFCKILSIKKQGTGLLSYIRPIVDSVKCLASMKSARIVLIEVAVYYNRRNDQVFNTQGLPVLSSCHIIFAIVGRFSSYTALKK